MLKKIPTAMPDRCQSPLFATCIAAFLLTLVAADPVRALAPHLEIKGLLRDARDVTVKCMECHKKKADEVLHSTHWSWKRLRTVNGKEVRYGKRDSLAAFAIDAGSNPARCLGCHVSNSTGMVDFDNAGPDMVDCLVCHDTTGLYRKRGNKADNFPGENVDLLLLARNAGIPRIKNCTTCHFTDCGLTQADLFKSPKQTDIHMRSNGAGFSCQSCHPGSSGHSSVEKLTDQSSESNAAPGGCISCHTDTPHAMTSLNRHTASVSCQTCHIPNYATDRPALIGWNWLMADKSAPVYRTGPGGTYQVHDRNGIWMAADIVPDYLWDDGSDIVYTRGQRIQPHDMVYLQKPGPRTPRSRIAPFRFVYGTQLYDTKYRYLISPLLGQPGNTIFPASDWDTIAREGMKAIILPYSGQFGFAPTVSYRRINHGVVPVDEALDCLDCHGLKGRIPWHRLGFDEDPMSRTAIRTPENEPLGREQGNARQKKLQPVQELSIPGGPGF